MKWVCVCICALFMENWKPREKRLNIVKYQSTKGVCSEDLGKWYTLGLLEKGKQKLNWRFLLFSFYKEKFPIVLQDSLPHPTGTWKGLTLRLSHPIKKATFVFLPNRETPALGGKEVGECKEKGKISKNLWQEINISLYFPLSPGFRVISK